MLVAIIAKGLTKRSKDIEWEFLKYQARSTGKPIFLACITQVPNNISHLAKKKEDTKKASSKYFEISYSYYLLCF